RGLNYDELINFVNESMLENIILTGKVGQRIYEGLIKDSGTHQNLYFTERFAEVIEIAGKVTRRGHSCLFSPAAASYDKFKNFEERGKLFKKLITET
ncbi:MAG: hypothetical protein K8S00_02240, partial [Bacteroidales bacterium]|nr:hypothetical protein [Bacteroidales bacterium]